MLVKENIVKEWYKPGSWVYRNFAYLFNNPLWSRDMPRGISVCPYFWLALFSLAILRPFVFSITRIFSPITKLFGSPFKALDRAIMSAIFRAAGDTYDGCANGAGLLVAVLVPVLVGCVTLSMIHLVRWYRTEIIKETIFMVLFWSVAGGLATAIAAFIYKVRHVEDQPRCRTEAYVYVWAVAVLLALIIFTPSEFASFWKLIGTGIWIGFAVVLKGILEGGKWIGIGLWLAVKWTGIILWKVISYAPIKSLLLPWWAYAGAALAVMGAFAWVQDRLMQVLERNLDEQQVKESRRREWLAVFASFMERPFWINQVSEDIQDRDRRNALTQTAPLIIRRACEIYWNDHLNALASHKLPLLIEIKFAKTRAGVDLRFDTLRNLLSKTDKHAADKLPAEFSESAFVQALHAARAETEFSKDIEFWFLQFKARTERRAAKQKRQAESPLRKLCLRLTDSILISAGKTTNALVSVCKIFWKAVCIAAKQVAIFFVYLWTLAKAKKSGACPYFTFDNKDTTNTATRK